VKGKESNTIKIVAYLPDTNMHDGTDRLVKDAKDLVRSVMVAMKPRDSRERVFPYRSMKLKTLKLAVQRLVLVCPAQEAKEILKAEQYDYNAIINEKLAVLNEDTEVETPENSEDIQPAVADAAVEVGGSDAALAETDVDEDDLIDQLYALPAYWESVQGTCFHSDSLGSIVVNASLMLSTQDLSCRKTETKPCLEKDVASKTRERRYRMDIFTETDFTQTEPHLEKDVDSEIQENSEHMELVTKFNSEEEKNEELCRRLCVLRN
jgi:hypothetical protein